MTWHVDFLTSAQRDLNQVSARIGPSLLEFIYSGIAENPQRRGKALRREMDGVWRARRGDYRVFYRIDEASRIVQVLLVAGALHTDPSAPPATCLGGQPRWRPADAQAAV